MGYFSTSFITTVILYLTYAFICSSIMAVEAAGKDNSGLDDPKISGSNTWNRYNVKRLTKPLYAINAYRRDHVNPAEFEFVDESDLDKRGTMDDYGHLRFGKRGQEWEDYGHMRFGKR